MDLWRKLIKGKKISRENLVFVLDFLSFPSTFSFPSQVPTQIYVPNTTFIFSLFYFNFSNTNSIVGLFFAGILNESARSGSIDNPSIPPTAHARKFYPLHCLRWSSPKLQVLLLCAKSRGVVHLSRRVCNQLGIM